MAQLPHQSKRLKPIMWNVFFFTARLLKNEATKKQSSIEEVNGANIIQIYTNNHRLDNLSNKLFSSIDIN